MNQDEFLDALVGRVGRDVELAGVDVPDELARPKSFLKILDAEHFNWEGDGFRKLFAMRFRVKLPPLDQLNTIFYPQPDLDAPIFICFALLTKRKLIAHLNVNCPFDDPAYRAQWVDPFTEILGRYEPFVSKDRYPEWMKKYRDDCTIYGLFPRDRTEDFMNCSVAYIDAYMQRMKDLQPVTDPERLARIRAFHDGFVDDIRTQDKAQGMMAKMIGKQTAHDIFYQVTT